jgi:hypothetical protein
MLLLIVGLKKLQPFALTAIQIFIGLEINKMTKFIPENLVGEVIGNLTVTKYLGEKRVKKTNNYYYIVTCQCGKQERTSRKYLKEYKRNCGSCSKKTRYGNLMRITSHLLNNLDTSEQVY